MLLLQSLALAASAASGGDGRKACEVWCPWVDSSWCVENGDDDINHRQKRT